MTENRIVAGLILYAAIDLAAFLAGLAQALISFAGGGPFLGPHETLGFYVFAPMTIAALVAALGALVVAAVLMWTRDQ